MDLAVRSCELNTTRNPLTRIFSIYNGIAVIGIALFYFPERNSAESRRPRSEVLKEIDYMGAFLSITGVALL
jgi:hypothetical protein